MTSYTGAFMFSCYPTDKDLAWLVEWSKQDFVALPDYDADADGPSGLRGIAHEDYYRDKFGLDTRRGHSVEHEVNGTWDPVHMRFVLDDVGGPKGGIAYQKGEGNPLLRVPSLRFPFDIDEYEAPHTSEHWVRLLPQSTTASPQELAHWVTLFHEVFYRRQGTGVRVSGRVAWAAGETGGAIRWSHARNMALVYTRHRMGRPAEDSG